MYYYATNTLPAISNSLPSVYSATIFQSDINTLTEERNKTLPVVIRQKIATTGDASKWPEEIVDGDYFTDAQNIDRNIILDSFLNRNHYKEAWSNKAFKILIPDTSGLSLKQSININ
jgi:hypothetical protein